MSVKIIIDIQEGLNGHSKIEAKHSIDETSTKQEMISATFIGECILKELNKTGNIILEERIYRER